MEDISIICITTLSSAPSARATNRTIRFEKTRPTDWINLTGCRTGNGDQLSSTQAEPGQAIKSTVA